MSAYDPGKGVLLNLRVIDQDAADSLSNHLQALLDQSTAGVASLTQLLEQSQHFLGDGSAIATQLAAHLETGAALQEALSARLSQTESLVDGFDKRQNDLDAACDRLMRETAEATRGLQELSKESCDRVQAVAESTESHLRSLAHDAEANVTTVTHDAESRVTTLALQVETNVKELAEGIEQRLAALSGDTDQRVQTLAGEAEQRFGALTDGVEQRLQSLTQNAEQTLHSLTHDTQQRIEALTANTQQRVQTITGDTEQRIRTLAEESCARVEREFNPAFERAAALAELLRNAEASLAVNALHAAIAGGAAATPTAHATPQAFAAPEPQPVPSPDPALQQQISEQSAVIASLEERIGEMSGRCSDLERKHKHTSENQAALLSGVSHELCREIDMLLSAADALRSTMLDQKQIDHLDDAKASASALLEMVRGITDLSFDLPRPPAETDGECDLRQEIQSMAGLSSKRARDNGQTLVCHVENDVPGIVRGDCGRLRQTLLYMLNGAFKLAGPGEITLRASVDHAVESHTTVRVTVSHQGRGIPQEHLNDLFNAIPQPGAEQASGDGVASPDSPHSSLSLAVARQLVQRMGGTVGVEADHSDQFSLWFAIDWRRPASSADNRRLHNRLPLESVQCNLGQVLDLSLGGARIRCVREYSGHIDLEIIDDDCTVRVSAEVMWCNRLGWRKHEVGLRFLDVAPSVAEQLTRLTMQNRVRRVMGQEPI